MLNLQKLQAENVWKMKNYNQTKALNIIFEKLKSANVGHFCLNDTKMFNGLSL